ncbi:MAG: LysM peptidoglycan-binding domain-containing protein [Anaerolineae bacterium]|nr:LysM peptidoglycan-binding domain-containing protein [Anaerolineae bacterium]
MKQYLLAIALVTLLVLTGSQVAVAAPEFQGGGAVHYVTWGESLSGIAFQYGVSVEAILQANGLMNPDMIYVGQPLIIPYGGSATNYFQTACASYYTVRTGDTLSGIAWDYNITLQQLLRMNNLYNKDVLYVGQTICVPTQQGYAPQQPAPGYTVQPASYYQPAGAVYYHTVVTGDTLSGIAYRYGVNYWTIMQANNLANLVIWPGQQLIIPGYQDSQPGYYQPQHPEPGYAAPPVAPVYEGSYAEDSPEEAPAAPDYQPSPARPALPRSEHPVEVVVNGGESWADDVYPSKMDPDGITTLIVQTGEENGVTVRVRSGDMESKGESFFGGEFGACRFVFRYIPPGDYDVWIDDPDTPSETAQVKIGAGERVEVAFSRQVRFQGQTYASPDGWVLSGWENPSKPGQNIGGWSNIMVKAPASGLNIIAESEGGGYKAKCFTGSKGPGACDFAGLMAGIYYIWIDGTDLRLKTYMDGNAYATFEFSHQSD